MQVDLKNKKVLLFAPKFFNYEQLIKQSIEEKGAIVHLYDERNNPSSLDKILYRKAKFLMKRKIKTFYDEISKSEIDFGPDYVVFINPETIDDYSISKLKSSFVNSKFIVYMWDSCENKNVKKYFRYFDKCLSFDRNDCEKYNLQFRPLFYNRQFEENNNTEYKYAFSFIGTVHSDRAKILGEIKKICDENNLPYYFYLYVPGRLLLGLRLLLNPAFRKWDKNYIHIKPLNNEEAAKVLASSYYIIDINHPKQTGLTMRTIEMIGLNRKILTTNMDVVNYDFYNTVNQMVIDRNKVSIPIEDIRKPYQVVEKNIYDKYSISSWIEDIFSE